MSLCFDPVTAAEEVDNLAGTLPHIDSLCGDSKAIVSIPIQKARAETKVRVHTPQKTCCPPPVLLQKQAPSRAEAMKGKRLKGDAALERDPLITGKLTHMVSLVGINEGKILERPEQW